MAKKIINKNLSETLTEEKVIKKPIKKTTKVGKKTEEGRSEITVKFKKLDPNAKIPSYAHDGDEGMDVYCTGVEYDIDNDCFILHTGLACESDKGVAGRCHVRSGNYKYDVYLANSVGIVDSEIYRGEIQFRYKNRDSRDLFVLTHTNIEFMLLPWWKRIFNKLDTWNRICYDIREQYIENALQFCPYQVGDRIGQIVFEEFRRVKVEEVNELSETIRGEGGFGSTGK